MRKIENKLYHALHTTYTSFLKNSLLLFLLSPPPLNCCVAVADTILLQPVMPWTWSCVVPIAIMSRLTQSIHHCFVAPLLRLPDGTIYRVFLPIYSLYRPFNCTNLLSLDFLLRYGMFSTIIKSLPGVIMSHTDDTYREVEAVSPSCFHIKAILKIILNGNEQKILKVKSEKHNPDSKEK